MKRYQNSLFIFRRDLRTTDNLGLNQALSQSEKVITSFIFDPRQLNRHPYQSVPGLDFMLQALNDLQQQCQQHHGYLHLFHTQPENVIRDLHHKIGLDAVFINRDYTPFSRKRDEAIQRLCGQLGIQFHSVSDLLLNEPEQLLKPDGKPYQVFTPFYNRAKQFPVATPVDCIESSWIPRMKALDDLTEYPVKQSGLTTSEIKGGTQNALSILDAIDRYQFYQQERDFPNQQATTQLSAHLKFGCCSVRQIYQAISAQLGPEHPLLRQLYWRDFFSHIAYHYPHVFGHAFHKEYDLLPWDNNEDFFWQWANGTTGFPIVDAGMRELNQSGFMHNRVRMITASFLVKDLHISWRWGERYFAQHLIDYDPCLNNGNWQWAASTGCDAQPYFRIFNPWLQQEKFDPDCLYIKRWIPELRHLDPKSIHQWHKPDVAGDYPKPMVDHSLQTSLIKERFKQALQSKSVDS